MEWRPGNTKDAPSERAWNPHAIRGATDAPEPQVVYKGKQLRIQRKNNRRYRTMRHLKIKVPREDAQGAG